MKAALSTEHWKVAPGESEMKVKVGVGSLVAPLGPSVIVVVGAVRSTVHVRLAGEGSTLPAWSTALTWNVWLPSERLV